MYDTSGNYSVCDERPFTDPYLMHRIGWLRAEITRAEQRARLYRRPDEESEARRMLDPMPTPEAFAVLGMFLGLFPPAVIFFRLFHYGFTPRHGLVVFLLCLGMNIVCFAVGRAMGRFVGRKIDGLGRPSWPLALAASAALGLLWGVVTGGLGGAVFFGFGAPVGAAAAVPVGTLAFALFAPLHRLLARDGMIEARHAWPLVFGVTGLIAALIASPHVF
ncbi:MAG TPA: hypothetical protein VF240_12790 [Pyrinomonadaceae bacterium]